MQAPRVPLSLAFFVFNKHLLVFPVSVQCQSFLRRKYFNLRNITEPTKISRLFFCFPEIKRYNGKSTNLEKYHRVLFHIGTFIYVKVPMYKIVIERATSYSMFLKSEAFYWFRRNSENGCSEWCGPKSEIKVPGTLPGAGGQGYPFHFLHHHWFYLHPLPGQHRKGEVLDPPG